jgi:hypothetical protein
MEWASENVMKINPSKFKAVYFKWTSVKDALNYTLGDLLFLEASSCKYFGIILCSDITWADHVSYKVKKAWKALHFIMVILKKGNCSTKSLMYTTLVCPNLEYASACWVPYREVKLQAIEWVPKKVAIFA